MKTIKIIALTVLVAFAGITKAQQPVNTNTSIESTKPDTIAPTLLTEEQKRLQEQALMKANMEAEKAAQKAAHEGGAVSEIRAVFDRAAQIDDIKTITGKDLNISKANERTVVGFAYEREIPLVGPAYLVYRFNYQTK